MLGFEGFWWVWGAFMRWKRPKRVKIQTPKIRFRLNCAKKRPPGVHFWKWPILVTFGWFWGENVEKVVEKVGFVFQLGYSEVCRGCWRGERGSGMDFCEVFKIIIFFLKKVFLEDGVQDFAQGYVADCVKIAVFGCLVHPLPLFGPRLLLSKRALFWERMWNCLFEVW